MISVAIMAHPKRARFVPYLLDRLDGAHVTVVWDEHEDIWDTGRRSLLAHHPAATDHLVVQDDALICRDLVATCWEMRRHVPHPHPIGLYYGSIRPRKKKVTQLYDRAWRTGARWISMRRSPLWGVALLIPTAHIPAIVEWGDVHVNLRGYDARVTGWYRSQDIPQMFPRPSLVEHRTGDGNPSLMPGRTNVRRVAHEFIGEERSGLEIDWRGQIVS